MPRPDGVEVWEVPPRIREASIPVPEDRAEWTLVPGRGQGEGWWLETIVAYWLASIGYTRIEVGAYIGDYEVDVIADANDLPRVLFSCKDWKNDRVPELDLWRVAHLAKLVRAKPGIVVTSWLTKDARRAAVSLDVDMVNTIDVVRMKDSIPDHSLYGATIKCETPTIVEDDSLVSLECGEQSWEEVESQI